MATPRAAARGRKLLVKLMLLVAVALPAWAESNKSFWTDCSKEFSRDNWRVYKPAAEKLRTQGYLVVTSVSRPYSEITPREVLGELYGKVDDLQIMGQKQTTVGEQPGTVVSFRGTLDEQPLVGRAAFSALGERTQLIVLVRHSQASADLLEEFERLLTQGVQSLESSQE